MLGMYSPGQPVQKRFCNAIDKDNCSWLVRVLSDSLRDSFPFSDVPAQFSLWIKKVDTVTRLFERTENIFLCHNKWYHRTMDSSNRRSG